VRKADVSPVGLDYLAPIRTFRNFFGRYGTTRGSIRGVYNGIVPVAVVDRYRDDTEGSLFGLTAFANVAAGGFGVFAMGSPTDDWELHAMNWALAYPLGAVGNEAFNLMVFTPDSTYVPVSTPAPAGFFVPGMNTDWAFTLGSVSCVAGHNPALPGRWGFIPNATNAETPGGLPFTEPFFSNEGRYSFRPPIRVYRDVTLGFIELAARANGHTLWLTVEYSIRPRTTDGPRTG
jgi:hypothetical protein